MFDVNMACHLWDLEDEGVGEVIDQLQGEIGVGGVTVLAAGGPLRTLRRWRGASPRVFGSRGGLFYQPDDAHFANTRCKPLVSGWLKARNPLSKVADACARHGLQLRASIDTRTIGRMATRFHDCAAKTVFGDVSPGRLCPHNPDANSFLRGLVADLSSNYPLQTIELRDLDRAFETDVISPADAEKLDDVSRELLAVCFCESCLQSAMSAGIDTNSAVKAAQTYLNGTIEGSGKPSDGLLEQENPCGAYVHHRREAHATLVGMLAGAATCDVALHVRSETILAGAADESIWTECQRVVTRFSSLPLEDCDGVLSAVKSAGGACEVQIPACEPHAADGTLMVKTMAHLAECGAAGVTLDSFGSMTSADLTTAKQAIRYSRRKITA